MLKDNFCKTLVTLASAKFIAWGLGALILVNNSEAFTIFENDAKYLPILMILVGLIGVTNTFLKVNAINAINSALYSLFWVYALYFFGLNNISFYRTIPESCALVYCFGYFMYNLPYDAALMKIKSFRIKKW